MMSKTRVRVRELFWGGFADDQQTVETIKAVWEQYQYLIDPHTAVGMNVYEQYLQATGDNTPAVVASTASPFKFSSDVAGAVLDGGELAGLDEFAVMSKLGEKAGLNIPGSLAELSQLPVRHQTVTSRDTMLDTVLEFLK